MKCGVCDAWTSVVETRGTLRKRRCGNNHTFWTKEVAELDARDKQIADAVAVQGMLISDAAKAFGIESNDYVSWVVRRCYPGFNARTVSNQTRRKTPK
jgi:hypothetical protein